MNLRVRSSEGVKNVRNLPTDIRWAAFVQSIAQATSIPASNLLLKVGYPPKPLLVSDGDALVFPALVTNGDTITAERSAEPPSLPAPPTSVPATTPPPAASTEAAASAPSTAAPPVSRPVPPRDEPPLNSDGVLIRRVIADDNSCLFNAVGYVLEGHSRTKAPVLRKLISDIVRSDPVSFSAAFLGQANAAYAEWILQPKTWGGAIELSILSDYYSTEICAFDVATTRMDCYGEGKGYKQRVFLVYDGLHYDAFGLNFAPDGPEDFDTTVFSPRDDYVSNNALSIVRSLKEKHLYTDTGSFQLLCGDCQAVLIGEKGATEHAMSTGHTNFTEKK